VQLVATEITGIATSCNEHCNSATSCNR